MRVLLTSCGLETEGIKTQFLELISKEGSVVKALFIPTAAVNADAIGVLPKCVNDLLKCGIRKESIVVYDLHKPMSAAELKMFDVVYLCGGSPEYLLNRMNEHGFSQSLLEFIEENGAVIGVSAGSVVFAQNLRGNLGLLPQCLNVHCRDDVCEKTGRLDLSRTESVKLGNRQAIVFEAKDHAYITE